jgi:cobalt-zinc-cadmium resistance protein CzcA
VYYHFDENNLTLSDAPLRVFGVQQDFRFPTVYFSERKLNKAKYALSENSYDIQEKGLERRLTAAYYSFQVAREKERVYKRLDSMYANFAKVAARRFELGETNYLEKITAASKQQQIHLNFKGAQKEVLAAYAEVLKTIQTKDSITIADEPVLKVLVTNMVIDNSPEIDFYQNRIAVSEAEKRFEKQQLLPDIGVEYFSGTTANTNERLSGYQVGLKIPLLFGGTSSRIKAAGFAADIAVAESEEYTIQLKTKLRNLKTELSQLQETLDYYENTGNQVSEEILKTAHVSFRNGEINFYQYIQSLESAYGITLDYLEKLQLYNQTAIAINYLTL